MALAHATPVTLYCLPYAGASAMTVYSRWRHLLPEWIEVRPLELPGRGRRMAEPLVTDIRILSTQLASELQGRLRHPCFLFGHSMGALIAYEIAHALQAVNASQPALVFVSGANAPTVRTEANRLASLHSNEELIAELRSLNGTPPEILENPELLELLLPVLKADFHMCGNYQRRHVSSLSCPIHVFGGRGDTVRIESLMAWQSETTEKFGCDVLDGGHFFIQSNEKNLLRLIVARVREALGLVTVVD